MITELRHAVAAAQLVLHYQPKATLADGNVLGVEALVRWQHPDQGLLFPAAFLPLAEQTGLIDTLTDWVLTQALADLRGLEPVRPGLTVSVNVSSRNLAKPDFAGRVLKILERVGVSPDRLVIEITERAGASAVLRELARAGVRISIDDFGRGPTSNGHLADVPLHELKVDRSFVSDMLSNPTHAALVASMIELGHRLGLRVVGVGVESDEVLARLRDLGCDAAQGFLLARPMPADQLWQWLSMGAWDHRASGRRLVGR